MIMNSLLFKLIVLFLIDRQISAQKFSDQKQFNCDADAAKAIRTDAEYGFFFNGKHLFIFLKNYLILFRQPTLAQEPDAKQISLQIRKPFFVYMHSRLYQGVKGVMDQNHEKFYSIRAGPNGFKCHLMDYSDLPAEINETKCDDRYLNTSGLLAPGDVYFYRYIREEGGLFEVKKSEVLNVFLKYRKNELVFEDKDNSSNFRTVIKLDHTVTKAAVDLHYENITYEIGEEPGGRRMMYINQVTLKRSEKYRLIDFSYRFTYQIPLDDYFGCIRKLESYNQIFGIFFNDGTVYLVLSQYYVKFEASLIDDRFEGVEEGALYENRTAYRSTEYQINMIKFDQSRKWVKMLNGQVYLSFDSGQVYKAIYSGEYIALERTGSIVFLACATQTLEVGGHVFCFDEKRYRKMELVDKRLVIPEDSKSHSIGEMFSQVKGFSYGEQNLQFIFNYLEGKFIFMTDKYFFIIDDRKIYLGANGKLAFQYQREVQLDYQENCLMEKCRTPKNRREKSNSYLLSVIVITLSTVALTLLVYYLVYKRAPKSRIVG